jgi:hypothetical protein
VKEKEISPARSRLSFESYRGRAFFMLCAAAPLRELLLRNNPRESADDSDVETVDKTGRAA